MKNFDVVVIGSGLSGAVCSYLLAKNDFEVALLSAQEDIYDSNSFKAQGGIVFKGKNDSADLLYNDICLAGKICNTHAVQDFSHYAPEIVQKILLEDLAIPFDKTEVGDFSLTLEGGHSQERILHSADCTGKTIMMGLIKELKKYPNIHIFPEHRALDLINQGERCIGAWVRKKHEEYAIPFIAQETVIATGGAGRLYLHTTNPQSARGEGLAMAARMGARIEAAEFMQFHPTALFCSQDRFLLSEAMRGEGSILLDRELRPFMHKFHEKKDLAPRDIVAKAIIAQMEENHSLHVWLDARPMGASFIQKRFPSIYHTCLERNIDITKDLIPIVPAAHYHIGGIEVDKYGRTNIVGLRAIGEAASTKIHGANRLASTSLLEALYLGHNAAIDIRKQKKGISFDQKKQQIFSAFSQDILPTIQNILWEQVGIQRNADSLALAVKDLSALYDKIPEKGLYEERNVIQAAYLIAQGACNNPRSIGCHNVI